MSSLRDVPGSAWKALFAAQLGWMLDSMDFLLFIFALKAVQKEFGLSGGAMGILTSVALVAGAVGGIAFGRLADRIGRVRAMSFSIVLYSLATAALATSHSLTEFILWRTLVGLGMGGEWSSGSVLVAETWPAEHRAKAIGLMQAGWAIGALAAAGLTALLLEPFGWRVLFLVGALPAVIALIIRRTVKEPEIWREQRKQPPSGSVFAKMFRPPLLRRTVLASLTASSVLIAYWGIMSWLPAFLATPVKEGGAGLSMTGSAEWMIAVQVGAFFGYVTFGLLADKLGRRPAFTLFMVGAAITVPIYSNAATFATVLILVGPLVGYFAHGYFSLFGAYLAELYPTAIRATAQGFCYNIGRLASAAAPFAIGLAADRNGLGAALAITSGFFLVAVIFIWMLPETRGSELATITAGGVADA
ncbi:MAG: MFS transporter [Thermoanaerobaculia bacterium]